MAAAVSAPGLPSEVAAAASFRVLCLERFCCGSSTFWREKRGALNGLPRASWVKAVGYMVASCLLAELRCK